MKNLQKRIDDTLDELSNISVTLDPDPLEFGPERITLKFANLDKHTQRLTQVELQLVQDIHKLKRSYDEENALYEAQKYKLMATDPRVKAEKTKSEREAAADRILEKERNFIRQLEANTADLEVVLVVVQTKRRDLTQTESRLRNQMKMVQESVSRLGEKWKRNPAPEEKISASLSSPKEKEEGEEKELEEFFSS